MNLIELDHALRQLRLGGMAAVLEVRLRQAQAEAMTPIDLLSSLVTDELTRRGDRLLERRRKQAGFRDQQTTLDNFDFSFNKKMNRSLVFDLATANFIAAAKTPCSLAHLVPARVTWPKPSARPLSNKATRCSTAKPTRSWMNSPTPRLMALAKNMWGIVNLSSK